MDQTTYGSDERQNRTTELYTKLLFSCIQNSKTLQDFPSHRIFERMREVLNIAKQNN